MRACAKCVRARAIGMRARACACVRSCMHMSARSSARARVCVRACVRACARARACVRACVRVRSCMRACRRLRACVYACMHMTARSRARVRACMCVRVRGVCVCASEPRAPVWFPFPPEACRSAATHNESPQGSAAHARSVVRTRTRVVLLRMPSAARAAQKGMSGRLGPERGYAKQQRRLQTHAWARLRGQCAYSMTYGRRALYGAQR